MFDMSEFEREALAIDQRHRTAVDALARRDDLTMPGKVTEAQRLETQRRAQVAQLQQTARDRHQAALQAAQAAQRAQRAAEVERRRSILGDTILLDVYRRRIDNANSDELLAMIEDAAPGFEAELVKELAAVTLDERTNMPNPSRADIQAWQALQPPADADYELRSAGQRIDQLDLQGYRASMADRLGVSAAHVPAPF